MTLRVLLIVDPQNDFCPGGALAVGEGDAIVPLVNRLMREGGYDHIVASQDWHPPGHGSFASSHAGSQVFEVIDLHGLPQRLWPDHGVQNTAGAEFHSSLDRALIEYVVRKGQDPRVDSYSAFFDNGGKNPTGLEDYLLRIAREKGLSLSEIEVDVVGLALDYCVKATAIDAARLGMRTRVILDATRAVDPTPESVREVLRELGEQGVEVETSREVFPQSAERESRSRESEVRREQGLNP